MLTTVSVGIAAHPSRTLICTKIASTTTELRAPVDQRDKAGNTLRALAANLISEVRRLDRRIAKAVRDVEATVEACTTTPTQVHGIVEVQGNSHHDPDADGIRAGGLLDGQVRAEEPNRVRVTDFFAVVVRASRCLLWRIALGSTLAIPRT